MRFVLYTHSLVSDWNHGNAHFLRGVLRELQARGHDTLALEPADGWSRRNLVAEQGDGPVLRFAAAFPELSVATYDDNFDHAAALQGADVVIVHEWTAPAVVARIGEMRRAGGLFTLLFHDTHHRGVSDDAAIADLALADYDAVLAFGETLRLRYEKQGWGRQAFTWHEAADTRLFRPLPAAMPRAGLVWIGNWGDGERARELRDYLIEPATALQMPGTVHGVRYPPAALQALAQSPLAYRGWISNLDVPQVFARHAMTVHVPRRPYVEALPGIPTIRVFEALACGIPLVCAPWCDTEGLFRPGTDYLMARDGAEMAGHLRSLREDDALAQHLRDCGLARIAERHSCAHRVDELMHILGERGTVRVRRALLEEAA